jgi:iron complex outermembrane receptor protein
VPDVVALATALPNTTLKASRATNTTLTAFIRGVGQADPLAGFEAGVGIYLDDIYLARPQGAVADIYDVERIEVLRGPQGTLYGRNTIGGAVKYVTRKLAPQTDVRIKGTLGNYKRKRDGVITASTPLRRPAARRRHVARFKRDGFGRNLFTGAPNYDKDLTAGRVSAEWQPTPDLFVRVAGDKTQDDSHPKNGHRLIVGRTSGAPILGNVYDTQANLNTALGHEQEVRQHGVSATLEWTDQSGPGGQVDHRAAPGQIVCTDRLRLAAGGRHGSAGAVHQQAVQPGIQPDLYRPDHPGRGRRLLHRRQRLQQVRHHPGRRRPHQHLHQRRHRHQGLGRVRRRQLQPDRRAAVVGSAAATPSTSARPMSTVRSTFGLNGSPEMGNPNAILFRTDTDLRNGELSREDKKFTPRVAVNWKATPDQNVYASWSKGFKGGGFDPRLNVVGTRITLDQAKRRLPSGNHRHHELGLKSSFNGGRITTNTAVFYSDYKDVQIPGSVAIDTNGDGKDDSFAGLTTNAGKAKIKGFELEAVAHITNFSLSGMYSYIDAKYDEYIVAGVNVANQRVFQNTPKNSANLRATYELPLPLAGFHNGSVLSKVIGSASLPAAPPTSSRTWRSRPGRLQAVRRGRGLDQQRPQDPFGVHGKNLADKRYKTAGYLSPTLGFEGTLTAFYGNPRTVRAPSSTVLTAVNSLQAGVAMPALEFERQGSHVHLH